MQNAENFVAAIFFSRFHFLHSPKCGKGCQMVYFQTENTNLGIFLEGLGMENLDIF
jgi:hypothetical protein